MKVSLRGRVSTVVFFAYFFTLVVLFQVHASQTILKIVFLIGTLIFPFVILLSIVEGIKTMEREKQKVQAIVAAGQAQWASHAILVDRGDFFAHLPPIPSPGEENYKKRFGGRPVGVLTLNHNTMCWTPDEETAQAGYDTFTFPAAGARQDTSGKYGPTWPTNNNIWVFPTSRIVLYLFDQTSDLCHMISSTG